MILRTRHLESLKRELANFPIGAILGARQVGKTTFARQLEKDWVGPSFDSNRAIRRAISAFNSADGSRSTMVSVPGNVFLAM